MITKDDITIGIIAYNRPTRISQCLSSLTDFKNIIVWDNTDDPSKRKEMMKLSKTIGRYLWLMSEENVGWGRACNQIMTRSKTDWVLWSADDMWYERGWFSIVESLLEERPWLEQIHLNAWNAMLVHKKTILRMGWWDEGYRKFPTMDDDDWYLRTVRELGYSPYGGISSNWVNKFPQEYKDWLKENWLDKQEHFFNRRDNFTYYCNSPYSKYPIVGKQTITGQEADAGSGNQMNKEALKREPGEAPKNGLQYHIQKYKLMNPDVWVEKAPDDVKKYATIGKDGRIWAEIKTKNGTDFIDTKQYEVGDDGMYPEETNKYLKRYGDTKMKPISFIQPSRNNLKYLKWSYNSIRKNLGYTHEICMADDFSNDGTWEWMQEIQKKDKNVKIHRNEGPTRLGHTILYDTLINDYATNDIVMIYHADMYALPGLDEEVSKYIKPGVVVSATRIEPPLHPEGPEKILRDYGIEPEEFKEQELLRDYESLKQNTTTNGIFAPWAIMKEDFQSIGGHDPLYAPQSKEDSDIFNRFLLAGYKFIQTWNGFVYHMTCRGSRFADGAKRNPDGQVFMKGRETNEWLKQNHRSTRNFIRKWGHFVKHDALLKPVVTPKYDIGFVVTNCRNDILYELEPWCSTIYVDSSIIQDYIDAEQKETAFDLKERVTPLMNKVDNDVIVEFDVNELNQEQFNYLCQLPEILSNDEELDVGEFDLGIFKITINKVKTYEQELIKCES